MFKKSLIGFFIVALVMVNLFLWPYVFKQIDVYKSQKDIQNTETAEGALKDISSNTKEASTEKEIPAEVDEPAQEESPEDSGYPENDDELIQKLELENVQKERTNWINQIKDEDQVLFADQELEGHIRSELGLYDKEITAGDLKSLRSLSDVPSCNLAGLEYAIELENLGLGRKMCHEDDADFTPLAYLPKLKSLNLYDNNIKHSYHFANLATLESLILDSTNIEELTDLRNLTNLQILGLGNTLSLTSLDGIESLKNLKSIAISSAPISDLGPLKNLPNVEELSIDSTKINDLTPISGLQKLTALSMNHTEVDDLSPLAKLTNLKTIYVENTYINDVTPLLKLPLLEEVSLFNNKHLDPESESVLQLKQKVWKTAGP